MRCAERLIVASAVMGVVLATHLRGESLVAAYGQRYAMGTMFDIVVYHGSKPDAQRAIEHALDEVVRLDRVMSHFDRESELSGLLREARHAEVRVDSSLFAVLRQALEMSRRSRGRFDVTIGPLLRTWKAADPERPPAEQLAAARACVGYEKIALAPPDRVRLLSDCVEIDLGGIGKGYAVDRAVHVLRSAGMRHAIVNAGGSSIAATGHAPGRDGWPVLIGGDNADGRVLVLRGQAMSTSQQDPGRRFGDIIDPVTAAPSVSRTTTTVIARTGTLSDALSTTLVLLSMDEGKELLAGFDGVSALWLSPDGLLQSTFGEPHLAPARAD